MFVFALLLLSLCCVFFGGLMFGAASSPVQIRCLPDGRMAPSCAAAYLGLDAKTLANYRCKGVGPRFVKLGWRIFYFQSDLDAWVLERRVQSTAQARFRGQAGVDAQAEG
jgi:hypothetical protein